MKRNTDIQFPDRLQSSNQKFIQQRQTTSPFQECNFVQFCLGKFHDISLRHKVLFNSYTFSFRNGTNSKERTPAAVASSKAMFTVRGKLIEKTASFYETGFRFDLQLRWGNSHCSSVFCP